MMYIGAASDAGTELLKLVAIVPAAGVADQADGHYTGFHVSGALSVTDLRFSVVDPTRGAVPLN